MQTRRFDIDWLRVIAIGLLLIYHVAIPFQPWGVFFGFIQNAESLETLWILMSMLNVWRIPLLFFVSGMGVYFSMKKRNWKNLFKERIMRILVPFTAGILLVIPVQFLLWQAYYGQDFKPVFHPGHLWFLGNIFVYVILLSPLLFYLKKRETVLREKLGNWVNHPAKLLLFAIPFIVVSLLISPDHYTLYAMTLHGFILGFFGFLFGFLFVYTGEPFWETVGKWKWGYLTIGVTLYILRVIQFEMESPLYLMPIETLVWIYTVLGIGYSYLNTSSKSLTYLSEAAYPVYIVHWVFIHLGGLWLFPMEMPVLIKFMLLTTFTFMGSILMYHLLIRRFNALRPIFGLKLT